RRSGPRRVPVGTLCPWRVLRAGRLARPVRSGPRPRCFAPVPPLDVPQRRARPGARAGWTAAARAAGPRAPAGHVRGLAAPRRAADPRSSRAPLGPVPVAALQARPDVLLD